MNSWTPSGLAGRRARWHETLSKFDLEVEYIPGKSNIVADAMSRYAYPASKGMQDCSWHGSLEDKEEMQKILEEELAEERMVAVILPRQEKKCPFLLLGEPCTASVNVTTRAGTQLQPRWRVPKPKLVAPSMVTPSLPPPPLTSPSPSP